MPTIIDWLYDKARPFLTPPIEMPSPHMGGRLKPFTKAEERRIRRLYVHEELSSYAIAEMIGRSRPGVTKALRRMGVKLRTLSQAARVRPGIRAPVPMKGAAQSHHASGD